MRGVQFLFVLFGAAVATIAPFVSVMLRERGLEPAAIGLVGAASALGFTLAVPVWGHLADMTLGRVRALQVAALGGGLSLVLFNLPWPVIVLGAMVVGYSVFQSALSPLVDAIAVGVLAERPQEYGRLRIWTSFSYAVVVLVVGLVYDRTGYGPVPFVWLGACVVLFFGLFLIHEGRRRRPAATHRRGGSARLALIAQPRLPRVLLVMGSMFFAILAAFTFLNIRLVELGGGPSTIAVAGGLSAIAEIPGMFFAARIAGRIGLRGLFLASALWYSACVLSWAVIDQPILIIASRAASGPAFAGLWVACVLTINVILPRNLQATGQALYQTTAFGVGAMLANALGGVIYQGLGPSTLFVLAAAAGLVAGIAGWLVLPRSGNLRRAEEPADTDAVDVAPIDAAVPA